MSRTTDDVEHVTLEVEDEHLVLVPDIEDVEDLDVEDVLLDIDAVVLDVEDRGRRPLCRGRRTVIEDKVLDVLESSTSSSRS